ncbi:hypothetical protein CBM2634_P130003 [Cupriavidus taiwanensis]|uniref:Transposase n=2 Tax=Cupriavidus taiwanensis TaxID=164546 RepID=A0A375JAD4_9BURK|nr:hypothetical protein CBM2634_P130003 [Cupriavidus taiwanensis]
MCLFAKRLERGRFAWPRAEGGVVALTNAQLGLLLEGFDWRQPIDATRPCSASFPDDIDALKALLLAREAALRECDSDVENLRDTVETLRKTSQIERCKSRA